MCGIAGSFTNGKVDAALVQRMTAPIVHRGPDAEGVWVDGDAGIGLGFRRLAIVDLSPAGMQPMASADGRYMIAYNGEIYNHQAVRQELEEAGGGPRSGGGGWRGHSDTEVLIEAIAHWGLRTTLEKSVGMFAIALWDRKKRVLSLARDRFGEKPLYYGWVGGDFLFSSELKSMRAHPRFDNRIDRGALKLMLGRTNVPAPLSIFERIFKLEPGCILHVAHPSVMRTQPLRPGESDEGQACERYWSYEDVVSRGLADPLEDEAEGLEALEAALADAVRGQSVADVPVGAFLSGGIDSSTIVAFYQKYSPGKVRTYTIGFQETKFDEAHYARVVAKHLGTEHNEQYVTVDEARDVIPLLPSMYDEPFADSSQIPTHVVSRFAREHVTVAMSGDGADELFGGYDRFRVVADLWSRFQKVPEPIRRLGGKALSPIPIAGWSALTGLVGRPHRGLQMRRLLSRIRKTHSLDDLYATFFDEWIGELSPVLGAPASSAFAPPRLDVPGAPAQAQLMYIDAMTYLPDDVLCKVDRASMATSLETRAPFLDHRVAAVAARLPITMKNRGDETKRILKMLLYKEAPRTLFERPKTGFGVPIGAWLRRSLRDWAEDLLDPAQMAQDGFLDATIVQKRWRAYLKGERDDVTGLWAILMFQAWKRSSPE